MSHSTFNPPPQAWGGVRGEVELTPKSATSLPSSPLARGEGYIALISAIIISVLLLIITFSVSFSSFFARFNILDSEFKKVSSGLAEACVDTAILEIAKGNDPPDDTCVNVGDSCPAGPKICKICEVNSSGSNYEIKTRAAYKKSFTNFVVNVTKTATDVDVNSWEEVADYTGVDCLVP